MYFSSDQSQLQERAQWMLEALYTHLRKADKILYVYGFYFPPGHFSLMIFCFWLSAYPNTHMQQGPVHRRLCRKFTGRKWMVRVWAHIGKMCSPYINMRVSAGDLIDMQIHRVITSCWATEMPTLTSVCSSLWLIKGFFCNPYHIVWKGWLTKHTLLTEEADCWS